MTSTPSPMNPLLEQFLSEARDLLESIGNKLMQLEAAPDDQEIINELFRSVHTLKGNSGLFTFPEMTTLLHAGEDLMGTVRSGDAVYSRELADSLLEAMDLVGVLCGDIESSQHINASRARDSRRMVKALRALMPSAEANQDEAKSVDINSASFAGKNFQVSPAEDPASGLQFDSIPRAVRLAAIEQCQQGEQLHWIVYKPQRECFFHGDDPLNSARQAPGLIWGRVILTGSLPPLAELDTYRCVLDFHLLTAAAPYVMLICDFFYVMNI